MSKRCCNCFRKITFETSFGGLCEECSDILLEELAEHYEDQQWAKLQNEEDKNHEDMLLYLGENHYD